VIEDATFGGPPANERAWRATWQAIGFLRVKQEEAQSIDERRMLRSMRFGMEEAATILNHRAGEQP
jgi:hypothetical protein